MYNEGISISGDVLDTGVTYGVIRKSGNSYSYKEEKLGVGRETAKTFLRSRPDMLAAIRTDVIEAVKVADIGPGTPVKPKDEDEDGAEPDGDETPGFEG
jgi:recombination protein RecA